MEEDKEILNRNVSDGCTCSILSSTSVLRLCFYIFPGKLRMMQSKTGADRFFYSFYRFNLVLSDSFRVLLPMSLSAAVAAG